MQGYLGVETIGSMRIYFSLFGLGYVASLIYLAFPIFRNIIFQMYDPLWFVLGAIIDAICGVLFLYFAISIKNLLLNSLHLITTVLYIRIGFMIATTPPLILSLIQRTNTGGLDWRLGIGLRLMYIWLFGYFLVSCKRLSKELRWQEEFIDFQNEAWCWVLELLWRQQFNKLGAADWPNLFVVLPRYQQPLTRTVRRSSNLRLCGWNINYFPQHWIHRD